MADDIKHFPARLRPPGPHIGKSLRPAYPRLIAARLFAAACSRLDSLAHSFDVLSSDLRRLVAVPRLMALASCRHTRLAYARLRPVAPATPWRRR